METKDFLSGVSRICKSSSCRDDCPLNFFCCLNYNDQTEEDFEKAEKVVKEWLKAHTKTRQTEFLKMYPDALMDDNGVMVINPCSLDKAHYTIPLCGCQCEDCRKQYWLKEVE